MARNNDTDIVNEFNHEGLKASQTIIEGSGKHLDHISTLDLFANNFEKDTHSHEEAQLLLVIRGLVTFDVHNTSRWLVPPQNAIWIPAGIEHSMTGIGEVELHCVYLDPGQTDITLANCCTVGVSPLLRELIIKMSNLPGHIDVNGPHARLITTMLDQGIGHINGLSRVDILADCSARTCGPVEVSIY
ncbi:AraC family ligand binding domain-containing protein [Haliea salexigens]|uniref:AraC family ligand binding domain-containing protein n=1 Tax=Haliea salexigens TaxID=287487 RepID=UPI000686C724|nr:AraC family ligand binding domain-containing protein [Haliea salexigens]